MKEKKEEEERERKARRQARGRCLERSPTGLRGGKLGRTPTSRAKIQPAETTSET